MKYEIVKTKVKFVKTLENGIGISIWYWKKMESNSWILQYEIFRDNNKILSIERSSQKMSVKSKDSGSQRCHTEGSGNAVITNAGQVNFMLQIRVVKRLEFFLGCMQAKKGNYSSVGGVFASAEICVSSPGFKCTNYLKGKYKCNSIDARSLFFTYTGEWEKVPVCLSTLLSLN